HIWTAAPPHARHAFPAREARAAFAPREDHAATARALRDGLEGFARPTLLIWGSNDRIVPPGYAEDWHAVLPHAEVALIPNGSHLLFDEFPAAVAALRRFLEA